jgi:hypothetical protein
MYGVRIAFISILSMGKKAGANYFNGFGNVIFITLLIKLNGFITVHGEDSKNWTNQTESCRVDRLRRPAFIFFAYDVNGGYP